MKNFFTGFSLMFLAIAIIAGLPLGGAMLFESLGYDKELGAIVGGLFLLCIGTGLMYVADIE